MRNKVVYIIFVLLCMSVSNFAQLLEQSEINKSITIEIENESFQSIIKLLETKYGFNFLYNPSDVKFAVKNSSFKDESIKNILDTILINSNLGHKISGNKIILFNKKKSIGIGSNKKHTIKGYIYDKQSTESLIGASIVDTKSGIGTTTNEYGFFSMTLLAGEYNLQASYIGYQSNINEIKLSKNIQIDFNLSSDAVLEEIVISDSEFTKEKHTQSQMSQINIPVKQLSAMPVIMGEEDIMKSIQLLPGIKSGTEGTSGIFVRGGSPDQNLILLDGVPVYNPAHALGIFSVFNSDALKSVSVTKGGFPARYGGRLSSVIDVRMKEGNLNEWHGDVSLGLISSKLSLSGPLVEDKVSILFSGRRTYADILAKLFLPDDPDQTVDPSLFFHDLNGKIQYKINAKHRIYLSGYFGKDKFGATFTDQTSKQKSLINWGNKISALRWNFEISDKLFANTTLTYSDYEITTENFDENLIDESLTTSNYSSGITDYGLKIDFDFSPTPKHYLKFGAGATRHAYNPGITQNEQIDNDSETGTGLKIAEIDAVETDVYIEDDIKLGKFSTNIGLHFSSFDVQTKVHYSLQPRLSANYLLTANTSLKGSFSTMTQFINLLTSEAINLPSDVWVPATNIIEPQQSWQAALGVAGILNNFTWEIEAYYKKMDNVLSYEEGASFIDRNPQNWEDQITQGKNDAYGMEFFLQKQSGDLTGWISYTLSWSNRQFEELNNNIAFPHRFDRRHDISTVLSYAVSKKIRISANWIYQTGNAVTIPQFQQVGFIPRTDFINVIENGGNKNSFRMSPVHRLDCSITFNKKKKNYERSWVISLYNAYYRKNPFFLDIKSELLIDDSNGNTIGRKNIVQEKSLIPILPSVSYKLSF